MVIKHKDKIMTLYKALVAVSLFACPLGLWAASDTGLNHKGVLQYSLIEKSSKKLSKKSDCEDYNEYHDECDDSHESSCCPGPQGPQGDRGHHGDKGERGHRGERGERGPHGDKGDRGCTGPAGPQGSTGPTGAAGATGAAGTNGTNGTNGATGAAGVTGATGSSFNSLIFNVLSLTDDSSIFPDGSPVVTNGSVNTITVPPGPGQVGIPGWTMLTASPGATGRQFSLTFNVPKDFVDVPGQTQVIAHFLTVPSSSLQVGNVQLLLTSLFAAHNTGIAFTSSSFVTQGIPLPVSVVNTVVTGTYIPYSVTFTLAGPTINPHDFAVLDLQRITTPNDFSAGILLTSVEFRYATN